MPSSWPQHPSLSMKIPYRIILAAVAASLILPLSAHAAKADKKKSDAKNPAATFATYDTDKSGSLSQEEYVAAMKEKLGEDGAKTHFAELDKNHDGQLSKEEFGVASDKKPAKGKKAKKNAV